MRAWPACSRAIAALLAIALAACVEPGQYGGPIPVDQGGFEARLVRACALSPQSVCGALATVEDDAVDGGEERDDADGAAKAAREEGTR